jgi:hypothetical protein
MLQKIAVIFSQQQKESSSKVTLVTPTGRSKVAALGAILDAHVLEFAVFEDFAAFQAFDKFSVFVPAHDLHARVLARLLLIGALWRRGRL